MHSYQVVLQFTAEVFNVFHLFEMGKEIVRQEEPGFLARDRQPRLAR